MTADSWAVLHLLKEMRRVHFELNAVNDVGRSGKKRGEDRERAVRVCDFGLKHGLSLEEIIDMILTAVYMKATGVMDTVKYDNVMSAVTNEEVIVWYSETKFFSKLHRLLSGDNTIREWVVAVFCHYYDARKGMYVKSARKV
jgi:hypothetical protein